MKISMMDFGGRHRFDLLASAALFLVAAMALGLLLRWQLAGVTNEPLGALYLRRAHSHIGFYGLLFPATWLLINRTGAWVPGKRLFLFYGAMTALSLFAFLWQSYSPLAIMSSTMILGVWLWFGWKNRPTREFWRQRNWLATTTPSIVIAAILIVLVATLSRRSPEVALQLARSFLAILLFGVFVPATLRQVSERAPLAPGWLLATAMMAAFLPGLFRNFLLGLGPLWLGFEISRSILHRSRSSVQIRDSRLRWTWATLALSLMLTGGGLLPHTYLSGIAGVHFLILGPLFLTFAMLHLDLREQPLTRLVYEASVVAMITAIILQDFWPSRILNLQTVAAIAGSLIFLTAGKLVFAKALKLLKRELA